MLEAAASTALKMPKLKTLEIWNGRVGSAALLRYEVKSSGCAVLSYLGIYLAASCHQSLESCGTRP
jgi:hypothetical protein